MRIVENSISINQLTFVLFSAFSWRATSTGGITSTANLMFIHSLEESPVRIVQLKNIFVILTSKTPLIFFVFKNCLDLVNIFVH